VVALPDIPTTSTEYTSDPDYKILDTLGDQDTDEGEFVEAITDHLLLNAMADMEVLESPVAEVAPRRKETTI
jgi:hypothetical protein